NLTNSVTSTGLVVQADSGGVTNVTGGVTLSTAAGPIAGTMSFTGPVIVGAGTVTLNTNSVLDGNIFFNSPVTGPGGLSVNTAGLGVPNAGGSFVATGIINLGGSLIFGAPGTAGANNITLEQTNATGGVQLRGQNAITLIGGLTTNGPVVIFANLDGAGSEGFTQNLGDIITTNAT